MKIVLLPGDGIGPDITVQAKKILDIVGDKYDRKFQYEYGLLGGVAIDKTGHPLPDETVEMCKDSKAIFLGAVGGDKWDTLPGHLRPEAGLLGIRKALGVYANLRPAILFPQLKSASTLKEEVLGDGLNIMILRELTGGIYFGDKGREGQGMEESAWDVEIYTRAEIERIAHMGFKIARSRGRKLTSIDKANVLESSRLWRTVVKEVAKEYKDVELNHMYVDNAAMQLLRNPQQFDVIVTNNIFGDILSDEAGMLTGSLGMLPSASLGDDNIGLYEPIHGSAPDIAGKDMANPLASIMSVAMMLEYSLDMQKAAEDVYTAVGNVLDEGYRTVDIMEEGKTQVGTNQMGDLVAKAIVQ
ncbi:MAG: 3-isopropylmalate dehydrogenase [Clostridiales bacterium]|nr:3-isopropylmalate dehydrogenase [Clostridiales bacterium]